MSKFSLVLSFIFSLIAATVPALPVHAADGPGPDSPECVIANWYRQNGTTRTEVVRNPQNTGQNMDLTVYEVEGTGVWDPMGGIVARIASETGLETDIVETKVAAMMQESRINVTGRTIGAPGTPWQYVSTFGDYPNWCPPPTGTTGAEKTDANESGDLTSLAGAAIVLLLATGAAGALALRRKQQAPEPVLH